jgi:hypothetical protein
MCDLHVLFHTISDQGNVRENVPLNQGADEEAKRPQQEEGECEKVMVQSQQ